MKKKMLTWIFLGMLAVPLYGCGSKTEKAEAVQTEQETVQETEQKSEDTDSEAPKEEKEEGSFSFADLERLEFWFSSGAGGWATQMTIGPDGSFSGEYYDSDMGSTGEGYPNGTQYRCDFSGQFTEPVKVNDYTYSMQIQDIQYEKEAGTEEIKDGILYVYSDAYGLDEAEDILIYLPGAPLAELPEEFRSWIGYSDPMMEMTDETKLPFYALNNEVLQEGFSSYDIVENVKEIVAAVEENEIALKSSLENDSLSQADYNEKTCELYGAWDNALNQVWSVLKQILDEDEMEALTVEERAWIAEKEQAVTEAGKEVEGGSMEPMLRNLKGAELTKERVYELLEYLESV